MQVAQKALTFKDANGYYPGFSVFVDFVSKLSKIWCDPVYGKDALKSFKQQHLKSVTSHTTEVKPLRDNDRDPVRNTAQRFSTLVTTRSCVVCNQSHRLYQCGPFKSTQPNKRFQIVKINNLCFNCLLPYHIYRNCRKPSQCSVPNCGLKHSKFLHVARENRFSSESASTSVNPASSSHNNQNGVSSNQVVSDSYPVWIAVPQAHVVVVLYIYLRSLLKWMAYKYLRCLMAALSIRWLQNRLHRACNCVAKNVIMYWIQLLAAKIRNQVLWKPLLLLLMVRFNKISVTWWLCPEYRVDMCLVMFEKGYAEPVPVPEINLKDGTVW